MRYNKIKEKFPREIVLLKGKKCSYGRCNFCNYTNDNSDDEMSNFEFNKKILSNVDGEYQTLEIINSGNFLDLDLHTIAYLIKIVKIKHIKVLYFESYLNHLHRLSNIKQLFTEAEVRFRLGLETFNDEHRKVLGKPFVLNNKLMGMIKKNYHSVCLLVGTVGQTKEMIKKDLELALSNFEYVTVNVFIDNGTKIVADTELKAWFIKNYQEQLHNNPQVELLIDNKDLGVFE